MNAMGQEKLRMRATTSRYLPTVIGWGHCLGNVQKRLRDILSVLLTAIVVAACTSSQLSSSEQDYLRRVLGTPLEFSIPEDDVPEAWARAQSFINNYGTSGVQNATDTIIRSTPPNRGIGFRYDVRRTPQGDSSRIRVEVLAADLRSGPMADRNGRILANYMQTGELPYPDLIAR